MLKVIVGIASVEREIEKLPRHPVHKCWTPELLNLIVQLSNDELIGAYLLPADIE